MKKTQPFSIFLEENLFIFLSSLYRSYIIGDKTKYLYLRK